MDAAAAEEDEEDDELDEQPATAKTDKATAPVAPASRRIRVRRGCCSCPESAERRHHEGVAKLDGR